MLRTSFSPFWHIVFYLVVGTSSVSFTHAEKSQDSILRVMTYNACRGGTYQGQPLSQSARMIELAKADIVGMQEIGENIPKLAELVQSKDIIDRMKSLYHRIKSNGPAPPESVSRY